MNNTQRALSSMEGRIWDTMEPTKENYDTIIDALEKQLEYDRKTKGIIYCEDCDYETKIGTYEECLVETTNDGGYVMSDKAGGFYSKCPHCGEDSLMWND